MKPTDPRIPAGYNWLVQQVGHQGDDCLLWPFSCCTPGYGMFMYEKVKRLAHRFMCELAHGPAPENHHAAHSCGNRRCVNPNHLSWKTQRDNQLDRRTHGTNNKTRTKINAVQADQIRKLKGIETSVQTAARYGVTESNVRLIQDGKTWGPRVVELWSPEEDSRIREGIKLGYNFRKIAEHVGAHRSMQAVTMRAYRIGLKSGQERAPRRAAAVPLL